MQALALLALLTGGASAELTVIARKMDFEMRPRRFLASIGLALFDQPRASIVLIAKLPPVPYKVASGRTVPLEQMFWGCAETRHEAVRWHRNQLHSYHCQRKQGVPICIFLCDPVKLDKTGSFWTATLDVPAQLHVSHADPQPATSSSSTSPPETSQPPFPGRVKGTVSDMVKC
ncbi:hypothetical protein M885DRAFT_496726 [Pelagophyceae sp. CCMP2097]|nr:hypothetical protein M885DRAFT_496726 [Pelagophyceae sp. CCMP2097]